MQVGSGAIEQSSFKQIIEESEPISAELKISQTETELDNQVDSIQMNKLERKDKKQKGKKEEMEKINDECGEYDSDSESDSDEEEDMIWEMKKGEMKQKKEKKKKDKGECMDKEGKEKKKKMKEKKKEMEMKKQEMEMKQNEADLEMMERQQKLFDKVVQMWEDDRKAWIEREKVLLEQIRFLQSLQGVQTSTVSDLQNEAQIATETEESQGQFDFVSGVEKAMSLRTEESGQESIGDTMEVQIPSTGEELARAMGMVDQSDVMDDLDQFMRMPKRGQPQQQPQQKNISNGVQTEQSMQNVVEEESQNVVEEESIAPPIVKETPSGPPPTLSLESDDIFWVNQLQAALLQKGYYSGEDEMEDWFFGEQTQAALLTFQSCSGIPETGTADEATWKALLGEHLKPIVPEGENTTLQDSNSNSNSNSNSSENISFSSMQSKELNSNSSNQNDKWPVLMEGDGGKEVHALQTVLNQQGFYCGGEDVEWWQFGSTTLEALKTFQECNKLAVSGVCDSKCWKILLGENSSSTDVQKIQAGDESDQDMSNSNGRIWLMGEQRWSEPSRLQESKSQQ